MRYIMPRMVILIVLVLGGGARTADAEMFLDLYGGYTTTADDTVDAERLFSFGAPQRASRSLSYGPSFAVGARLGLFYEYFGFAFDVSYFEANDTDVQNAIFSLTPLLMLRGQFFKSDDMPRGRLQPYLAAGPGFFIADQEVDFRPDIANPINNLGFGIGIDARAGLRWLFSANLGLYGEYRLTHFNTDSTNDDDAIFFSETHVNATLTTHHVLGGFTFSF